MGCWFCAFEAKIGLGLDLPFQDEPEGVENAGVGAVFAEVALQNIKQVIIKSAEGPDDDREEDERFEVRRLYQESGGSEQAEE